MGRRLVFALGLAMAAAALLAPATAADSPGTTWTRIDLDRPGCDPCHMLEVTALVRGDAGFVAFGRGLQNSVVVAVSPTGRTWDLLTELELFADARVEDAAFIDGRYIAVGEQARVATSWASDDGLHWTRSTIDAGGDWAASIAVRPGQAVVVGSVGFQSAAWRSTDGGRTWSRGSTPVVEEGIDSDLRDVLVDGDGLVAVGVVVGGDPAYVPQMLRSTDGLDWKPMDVAPSEGQTDRVIRATTGLVAAGDGAWVRRDGGRWEEVPHAPPFIEALVPVRGGVLALEPLRPILWFSADGSTWRKVHDPDFAGSDLPGDTTLDHLAQMIVIDNKVYGLGEGSTMWVTSADLPATDSEPGVAVRTPDESSAGTAILTFVIALAMASVVLSCRARRDPI